MKKTAKKGQNGAIKNATIVFIVVISRRKALKNAVLSNNLVISQLASISS
jgi:hypothetical protein